MYCVKCKKRTETTNERITTTKNNKHIKRGMCVVCGMTKTQFIKAPAGGSLLTHSILESILLIHLENLRLTDKPLENCIFSQCFLIIHYCSKIIIINIPKLYITRKIIKCSIK